MFPTSQIQKFQNFKHIKKTNINTLSFSANIKFNNTNKDKKRQYSPTYTRKAISVEKSNTINQDKYKSLNNISSSNSVKKHIQGKKMASLQYNTSNTKTESNTRSQFHKDSSSFMLKKDDNLSFITEKKTKMQSTEGMIRELKSTFSQEKLRRKKILNLNSDIFQIVNDSFGNHSFLNKGNTNKNLNTQSLTSMNNINKDKNISDNNYSTSAILNTVTNFVPLNYKKEISLKLFNDTNKTVKDSNSNPKKYNLGKIFSSSSINTSKTFFNSSVPQKLVKQLNDIEERMTKNIKECKGSKSKKYNALKHSFEEIIKALPQNNQLLRKLLEKIINGYHEIVLAFSNENSELREGNLKLSNLLEICKNSYNDNLINKDKEIEMLKKKISELAVSSDIPSTGPGMPTSSNEKESSHRKSIKLQIKEQKDLSNMHLRFNSMNEKIININKDNLSDLDALYFFNKVEMEPSKSSSLKNIPFLNFNKHK